MRGAAELQLRRTQFFEKPWNTLLVYVKVCPHIPVVNENLTHWFKVHRILGAARCCTVLNQSLLPQTLSPFYQFFDVWNETFSKEGLFLAERIDVYSIIAIFLCITSCRTPVIWKLLTTGSDSDFFFCISNRIHIDDPRLKSQHHMILMYYVP